MTPKPYSEKSSLPIDSSEEAVSGISTDILPQTPSPETLSAATTPSPPPQEVPVETFVETVVLQENNRVQHLATVTPCYPTPGDIMPYDHSLPDFIRQITNEQNLANLQKLSLRVISTLISLHRMSTYLPNLRELDLEGSILNSLRDIGCSLKNLQVLKVGRCQLESLDGTFGLTSLRELYAQKNFINDVSPCSNLPHIRHIDVSGNRIRNISYAGFLSVCSKLKSIVFTGNPATEASDYRMHVRRILPQIESLDGVPFTKEDETGVIQSEQENPDFATISSNDTYLEWAKNKEIKILADQMQPDAAGCNWREVSPGGNGDIQRHTEFQHSNLFGAEGRKLYLDREESTCNKYVNPKQKSTNIQKLDKDMVNRSKKTNSLKIGNFSEEFGSSSGIPKHSHSDGSDKAESFRNIPSMEEELAGISNGGFVCSSTIKSDNLSEISSLPLTEPKDAEEGPNCELNKLTTGLPVCGNLTAALRNRKKIQNGWTESQCFVSHKTVSQTTTDAEKLEEIFDFGENLDYATAVDIREDVLLSKKWNKSRSREDGDKPNDEQHSNRHD